MEIHFGNSKLETLINLYTESGSIQVLNKLRKEYGDRVLLSLGINELNLYVGLVLSGRYDLLYEIDKVDLLRKVHSFIIDKFFNTDDIEFNLGVVRFINSYVFGNRNRFINKQNKDFLIALLTGKRMISETDYEESYNWESEVVNAIINNKTINKEELYSIAESYPRLYVNIIENLWTIIPITSLFDLIYELSYIKNCMDIINEMYSKMFNTNEYLQEGIEYLLTSDNFYNFVFPLMYTISKADTFRLQKYKEMYQLFFTLFFSSSESIINTIQKTFDSEMEDNGIFPLDIISDNVERMTIEGIFYILYYGEYIKDKLSTTLFYDRTGLEEKIDKLNDGFNYLVIEKIIPENFKDVSKWMEDTERAEELIKNDSSQFNIDDFLKEDIYG